MCIKCWEISGVCQPLPTCLTNQATVIDYRDYSQLKEEYEKLKAENEELHKNNKWLTNRIDQFNDIRRQYQIIFKELENLRKANQRFKENNAWYEENYNWQIKENEKIKLENQQLKAQLHCIFAASCVSCGKEGNDKNCWFKDGLCHKCKLKKPLLVPPDEPEYSDYSGVKLDSKPKRVPYKCPVCRGITGICRIYEQISDECKQFGIAKQDEKGTWYIGCIACNGTGIVWEPK